MIAWVAGVIAVTPIDTTYMGKWAGLEFANTQQKTLPYDLELNLIFQHGEGTKDTAAYQVRYICVYMYTYTHTHAYTHA
jgi:hypothetical protein